ncbi:MAG: ATP-binding cassette domain-containing protein [Synergistaceae bacterium]|jgi:peptide/nickel transport system ATP-binding protein/oligopeptide transport system ATP-binding protein|nr:ATP-binding cassette domain-containing protein [Synergistaceae bacterium]
MEKTEKKVDSELVRVESLKKYFPVGSGLWHAKKNVKAVDDVSFDIKESETLGLVGESGCGKSTLGRTILGLWPTTGGRILFEGEDIAALRGVDLKSMRKKMQLIFQDPSACLNPRKTVRAILEAPFKIHRMGKEDERIEKICGLLENVGLSKHYLSRYPHEMSGGQKQRVSIARAIALRPKLVICDEAVSALDVSIQAQVINLLEDLQSEFSLTYLFISHNLSVVHHISDRVGVMYLGRLVELASKKDLFEDTLHPYSKALISAIPEADPGKKRRGSALSGDVPSPADPPAGCAFHTRCPEAADICRIKTPALLEKKGSHLVACHLL